MPAELDGFLALALSLADAAGEAIRPYFRQPLAVDDKADLTPVTAADRAAEQAMRSLIESRFPEHGIIGEEFGRAREDAEFVWTLDPIDGTKSFISGVPLFGTLIALDPQPAPDPRHHRPADFARALGWGCRPSDDLERRGGPLPSLRRACCRHALCHDSRHVQGWRCRGLRPSVAARQS